MYILFFVFLFSQLFSSDLKNIAIEKDLIQSYRACLEYLPKKSTPPEQQEEEIIENVKNINLALHTYANALNLNYNQIIRSGEKFYQQKPKGKENLFPINDDFLVIISNTKNTFQEVHSNASLLVKFCFDINATYKEKIPSLAFSHQSHQSWFWLNPEPCARIIFQAFKNLKLYEENQIGTIESNTRKWKTAEKKEKRIKYLVLTILCLSILTVPFGVWYYITHIKKK